MNEIQGVKGPSAPEELATATVLHGRDIEDERDRAIAKAALTISELGPYPSFFPSLPSSTDQSCE